MPMMRAISPIATLLAAATVTACATSRDAVAEGDPLEDVNRPMHGFNQAVAKRVVGPAADRFDDSMDEESANSVDTGVHHARNVLSNLGAPTNAINGALQGEPGTVGVAASRFVINSTVGVLGLFDVAERVHLHEREEDFGQTLGKWGSPPGPYLVAPIAGPTNARDVSGLVVDGVLNPLSLPGALAAANVGVRAADAMDEAQETAEAPDVDDRYRMERRSYDARRAAEIANADHAAHERGPAQIEHRYAPRD